MIIILKRFLIILTLQLVVLNCWCFKTQITGSEVAFLSTDRISYIAGETIFYKLYVLDAVTQKLSGVSKVGYLLLRSTNSNLYVRIRVRIDEGMARGSFVLPDTLTSGVYQILAFTSMMKNQDDGQHFFHKEIVISNRYDKELDFKLLNPTKTIRSHTDDLLKITKDKPVYGLREKVSINLEKTKLKSNVAVSVYEESNLISADNSIVETLEELPKTDIGKQSSNEYLPESNGKILRGRVIDANSHIVPAATILLSCADTIPNLQYAYSSSNGIFQLLLSDYYNGKELFLTIKDMPENEHWKIEIDDEFNLSEKWNPALTFNNNDSKEFIAKSQNIVYVNKVYQLNNDSSIKPKIEINSICPQFYHCQVNTVLLSDFVPLNDFPEIVVELFPLIKLNKQNYHVRIIGIPDSHINAEPAIFMDGVFVDDVNKIIDLGSDKIKKIDVIYAERIFGDLVFQGVISITTKSNEILHTLPASYSIRFKNDKFNSARNFVLEDPVLIQNRNTPFFKQLLYWNPDLELNGIDSTHFEFYTSDNAATFRIQINGISEDGTPISSSSRIEVNNEHPTDK